MATFSVIIPTHNSADRVLRCIRQIERMTRRPDVEIIVVANGCTDNTAQIVQSAGFTALKLNRNIGYSAACNLAVREAHGKYLLFLNDDTLPGPEFIERLHACFRDFEKKTKLGPVAAVGPVSNNVGGIQRIDVRGNTSTQEDNVEAIQAQIDRQNPLWVPAGMLSGFCLFTSRKVWDAVEARTLERNPEQKHGAFDERFPFGCEDNAFAYTATELGYYLGVCTNSYVYHEGHQTVDRPEFRNLERGTRDVHKFNMLYHQDKPQSVAAGYRVKLRNDYEAEIFRRSLLRSMSLFDAVHIYEDASGDGPMVQHVLDTIDLPNTNHEKVVHLTHNNEGNERDQRNAMLGSIHEAGHDWVFSLDADEIIAQPFNRARLDVLTHPYWAAAWCHMAQFYNFWDTENLWRADKHWIYSEGMRLCRLTPNWQIRLGQENGLHCGNVRAWPTEQCMPSNIRIEHYGYVRPEDRERKKNWYNEFDQEKDPSLIGYEDYNHLTDTDVKLYPWKPEYTLTVGSIMRDEHARLPYYLGTAQAAADATVLVDTGSSDDSVQMARDAGATVIEYDRPFKHDQNDDFSRARNVVLDNVDTDWMFTLDIDERPKSWGFLHRLITMADDDRTWTFTVENIQQDAMSNPSHTVRLFPTCHELRYSNRIHEVLDDSIEAKGDTVRRFQSPMSLVNYGFLAENLRQKFVWYFMLNLKQLSEEPNNCRPYFNLALHLLEKPELEAVGASLLARAVELQPKFGVAVRELGMLRIWDGYRILDRIRQDKIVPEHHLLRKQVDAVLQRLEPIVAGAFTPVDPQHVDIAIEMIAKSEPELLKLIGLEVMPQDETEEVVDATPG